MDEITDFKVTDCSESQYVKPLRLCYKQNGISKIWDVVQSHSSVSIIIFNVTRKVLIFVKQYRPAVHFTSIPPEARRGTAEGEPIDLAEYPGSRGITLELCAGIVDKRESLEEIARQEVLEECGYDVPASSLELVVTIRGNVGIMGDRQNMYYAEVTDAMKVSEGGGNRSEGEFIQVVEMDVGRVREYLATKDVMSPMGMLFGVSWFLANKAAKFES